MISFDVQNGDVLPRELGFKIYFTNTGHVFAQDFAADVTITHETMTTHSPIGSPFHWKVEKCPVRTGDFGNGPMKDVEYRI